jgi:hypothetical protein
MAAHAAEGSTHLAACLADRPDVSSRVWSLIVGTAWRSRLSIEHVTALVDLSRHISTVKFAEC